ncbi:MAG: hypothetical protein ABJB86_07720 [Bacteroidota bacterium]
MRVLLFIPLACMMFFSSCKAQVKQDSAGKKNTIMERFDIERFNKNKVNGQYNFINIEHAQVRQVENKEDYTEEIKLPTSPYTKVKAYFKVKGFLKISGEKFYAVPVGVWKYFDSNEKLQKETDWDTPFAFTIKDLDKKMKSLGIEIMVPGGGVNVHRSNIASPLYIVSYPVNKNNPYQIYQLKIDGKTGETIEKTTVVTKN